MSASEALFELPLQQLKGGILDDPILFSLELNQGMYVNSENDVTFVELKFATCNNITQELSYQTMFNLNLNEKIYSVGSEYGLMFELPLQTERYIYPGEGLW